MSAEQRERLEVLLNDMKMSKPTEGLTYHSLAGMADPAPGGRFAVGAAEVPRLPANSPWSQNVLNGPDPLGYAIDQQEPVGSPAEIAASMRTGVSPSTPAPPVEHGAVTSGIGAPGGTNIKRRL